ncbi:MAG: hypothetical protein J2P17_00455, partial [Mycobacterium sp.]|nr:hypothetical protein [Mycobacterium sp.]
MTIHGEFYAAAPTDSVLVRVSGVGVSVKGIDKLGHLLAALDAPPASYQAHGGWRPRLRPKPSHLTS